MFRVTIDTRDLEAKLKKLSKDLNKTAEETITEMAQTGGRQLAFRIEPYGLNSKAEQIAKKAIYKDVNSAYDYVGQTYNEIKKLNPRLAIAYSKAVNDGDLNAAEQYARTAIKQYEMRETDYSGAHLDSIRNRKGRVDYNNQRVMGIKNNAEIDTIKTKKSVTAGISKSGWLQAAKDIGAKTRIPSWLRKSKNYGRAQIIRNGWNTIVTLFNDVPYISNLMTPSKVDAALKNAYRNQVKRMEKQLKAITSRF